MYNMKPTYTKAASAHGSWNLVHFSVRIEVQQFGVMLRDHLPYSCNLVSICASYMLASLQI